MPRPTKPRRVSFRPPHQFFKPAGVPSKELEQVALTLDELEALRLAHLEGYYQAAISRRMGVSRPTAGIILENAHRKITECLVEGKALVIEQGATVHDTHPPEDCPKCGEEVNDEWQDQCPRCGRGRRHRGRHGKG